ncbi:MAG: NTP transferase domain-containing protein [Alphaproteobacteria bacterium]|nr:NTP transferase domain-containing protein [Alphaproteobacteria bacterium]
MEMREHIRVVAVIQARMGSTRLPGKVLKPIAGKPLLWHIVHRLRACHLIEEIAVATTVNPADEAIVEWCNAEGVAVVRGSEEDVLARYAAAAEKLDADIIVRVSSDAPFIDAGFVDHLIATLIEQDGDYVLLEEGADCAHEGVDPFSRRALDKLMMDAATDPAAREHVTGYFKLHPDFVKIVRAAPYPPLAGKGGRLTIDTPDDLAFIEAVHARLAARAGEASLADLLLLLEREPDLTRINAHVKQKPIAGATGQTAGGVALIRCDGGGAFGYGHVKRMVSLARSLRDQEGIGAVFALNGTRDAAAPIRRAGFQVTMLHGASDLETLIDTIGPDILLLDGREGPTRAELEKLKRGIPVTAVIDDAGERRLAADYAYYPPVPQAHALDWTGTNTLPRIGWQWTLTGLNPNAAPGPQLKPALPKSGRPTVLVAMGGSDPLGLTLRCARALAPLDTVFRVRFVIGAGMKDGKKIAEGLVKLKSNYETVEGANDLSIEYANADLALCAFGVTAYELASTGTPAIYLGISEDHAISAGAFAEAGMGISLGLAARLSDADILRTVSWLLQKPLARREMRAAGLSLIDGQGASRIAADLAAALTSARTPLKTAL